MPDRDQDLDDSLGSDPTLGLSEDATAAAPGPAPTSSEESRFAAGTILAERYRIVSSLGRGGMGEVYRADDLKLGGSVALKFLPPGLEQDELRLSLLFDEIKIARQITHPNVCRVYDLGEADDVHFLSMEYIDGEDLASLLKRIGRLPRDKAVEIGRQTCAGLAAAHEAGILHRDLKPANLMLDGRGSIRIADFGLAVLSDSVHGAAVRSGTPAYMAPEQLAGREVSVQSDLYALGLVLFELFTGRRAFEATSVAELSRLRAESAPAAPSTLVEGLDPGIEHILLRCLAAEPRERPSSAAEVAEALSVKAGIAEGTQLRTLVMTALSGKEKLVERLGDRAGAELLAAHEHLTRELLHKHSGREIDDADGLLLLFERPWQAVRFALAYHRGLEEVSRDHGVEVSARVGIHLGEVVVRRTPPSEAVGGAASFQVEGLAKPLASRLRSLARGRQTLLTGSAFDLARRGAVGESEEAGALRWLAHGEYLFEGTEEPLEVFEVGVETKAPLAAPEESDRVQRLGGRDVILGWRPAAGLAIPHRQNWVVEEKLGEGGFGEVWLGKHRKTGEHRVYKFCYEKERLSSLQREITVFRLLKEELGLRDDIARVLDWNLEEPPYFVEFAHAEGGSLVDWAKTRGGIDRVPLAERLEIAAQVATALAAAHSVGVLHKDVKPGNVLVSTRDDERPHAILTDFGIGMITDQQRLAAKGITVLGMTELEPATGGSTATGTQLYLAPELLAGQPATIQADVYALGVMLYQIAVGDLARPMPHGWKRHVEDDLLRRDIADCVDGDPARRPGSAADVARRLRALEERRAERAAERKRQLDAEKARRRRRVLGIAASVSTVFLVVVSLLAIQAIRARADAERRRGQAEQLIDFMLNDLHEGLDKIGRLNLLAGVAQSSKEYFDSLTDRDESPDLLDKRGTTLQNIGDVLLDQGDAEAALAAQRSAVGLFEEAASLDRANDRWQLGLGLSRLRLGKTLAARGETDAALEVYGEAMDELETLAAADPEALGPRFALAEAHFLRGALQRQIGDIGAAVGSGRSAVRLVEEVSAAGSAGWRQSLLLLDAHLLVGEAHRFDNARPEALEALSRARELALRLSEEDPGNTYWPRRLAVAYEMIGTLLYTGGDPRAALESFQAARAVYQELVKTDPTRVEWRQRMTESSRLIGYAFMAGGDSEAALELFRESVAVLESLLAEDPSRATWLFQLAQSHQLIGVLHLDAGRLPAAESSMVAGIDLLERLIAVSGDDPKLQNMLSFGHVRLGDVYARDNDEARARAEWSRAVEIIEPVTAAATEVTYVDTQAQALLRLGRLEDARPLVEDLLARGWDDEEFLQAVRNSGLDLQLP